MTRLLNECLKLPVQWLSYCDQDLFGSLYRLALPLAGMLDGAPDLPFGGTGAGT
jgi:hypothetical protein